MKTSIYFFILTSFCFSSELLGQSSNFLSNRISIDFGFGKLISEVPFLVKNSNHVSLGYDKNFKPKLGYGISVFHFSGRALDTDLVFFRDPIDGDRSFWFPAVKVNMVGLGLGLFYDIGIIEKLDIQLRADLKLLGPTIRIDFFDESGISYADNIFEFQGISDEKELLNKIMIVYDFEYETEIEEISNLIVASAFSLNISYQFANEFFFRFGSNYYLFNQNILSFEDSIHQFKFDINENYWAAYLSLGIRF